jgi:putative ABC transport system permease protein
MSTLKLLLAEIRYRKVNFVLSLFAVTIAVALFVTSPVLVDGYGDETKAELHRLGARVAESQARVTESEQKAAKELAELEDETRQVMRDLGFNLSIVHRDTDIIDFLSTGISSVYMPEEYVETLAKNPSLTMVTHFVGTLRAEVEWEGRQVRLDGYLPEIPLSHKPATEFAKKWGHQRTPMGYDIEPGSVFLGHALGQGHEEGQTTEVLGKQFTIAKVLPEKGSKQDATLAMHLSDAQALLEKPDQINQILALECRCAAADLPKIRAQLADALPQTHVVRDVSRAVARARQRAAVKKKVQTIVARQKRDLAQRQKDLEETAARRTKIQENMETLATAMTSLVVLAAAVWVGLLALANVRERVTEIGVFRALGKSSARIASLFLGKAVLLGLAGAMLGFLLGTVVGFLLGTGATQWLGFEPLYAAADHFQFPYELFLVSLIGAPLLSAGASYLPTLSAITQDPAVVLRDH